MILGKDAKILANLQVERAEVEKEKEFIKTIFNAQCSMFNIQCSMQRFFGIM